VIRLDFPSKRRAECSARQAERRSSEALISAVPLEPSDEARPLPQLARPPVQFLSRGLDRSVVVVGFEPFRRRDLPHAIEAVKPV